MKDPFTHEGPVRTWRARFTGGNTVHTLCYRSHVDDPFTCGDPIQTFVTCSWDECIREVPFWRGWSVHLWRSRSHWGPVRGVNTWGICSHVEVTFICWGPVYKWRSCSHMLFPFAHWGPILTWRTRSKVQASFTRREPALIWRSRSHIEEHFSHLCLTWYIVFMFVRTARGGGGGTESWLPCFFFVWCYWKSMIYGCGSSCTSPLSFLFTKPKTRIQYADHAWRSFIIFSWKGFC